MDLKVYLPTFNIEKHESEPLEKFMQLLDQSKNRENAFFDESISGYIVLTNDDELSDLETETYLQTLKDAFISIDLSVHTSKTRGIARDQFQIKTYNYSFADCIYNDHVDVVIDDEDSTVFVSIWKFSIPISYPKKKVNSPEIIISILLTCANYHTLVDKSTSTLASTSKLMLNENGSTDELTLKEVYKPVKELNLLDGLVPQVKVHSLQTQLAPVITASQLSTEEFVVEVKEKRSSIISVEAIESTVSLNAKILLPVYPVLNMRLKCTKPAGRNDILLTTLEIESSKELKKINTALYLYEINVEFPNGSIKPLIPPSLLQFPIKIEFGDNLNFIYELLNNNSSENLAKKPIMVTLISKPYQKDDENNNSFSKITTKWNTIVDFSIIAPPTNTALKSQASNLRSSKKGAHSILPNNPLGTNDITSPVLNSASVSLGVNADPISSELHQRLKNQSRNASTSLTVNIPRNSKSSLNGLILSFHGTTNVQVGQIFKWKIQAINKAHKILNLSLYIQPKDNNNHSFLTTNITEIATPKVSSSGFDTPYNKIDTHQIIYPYTNVAESSINLTKVLNQTKLTPTGIICLNNDVRIGPFDHYSVFETEINLIAIEKGIFSLQGVKIIDITSGESFDCGKLLEVVVFD